MSLVFRPKHVFGETFLSLKRNFLMGFTAITTVAITLFIVGVFSIIVYDIQSILKSIESQVEIAVYLKDNISNDLKDYLENEIKSWPEVNNITYVSKDQALEKFKIQNEGSDILKEIQGNPLPASFEVKLKDPQKVEQVALRFVDKDGKSIDGVDEVIYGKSYIRKLFSITAVTGTIALLIIIILLLAAMVLIYNTIRLSIYARRKEIEVMKLVGATNWYVRTPFLFEGFFEGFMGAGIAVLLLYFLNKFLMIKGETAIVETMHIKNLAILGSSSIILIAYFGMIIIGGFLGILSSGFALRRYLKV
ncbi:MAG: permease-like cell division protein FtsX [Actinomycetota bacterium]|nr:permease-like cell division protein FtsX [Actinomycetota bacterium]